MEPVHRESFRRQRVTMLLVLCRQEEKIRDLRRRLAEGEGVDGVRDIRERQVQRPLLVVHSLEVNGTRHARNINRALDPAALREDVVELGTCVEMPLAHFFSGKRRKAFDLPRSSVVHKLLAVATTSVQPDGGETLHLLLLTSFLEVHAVDLQSSDVGLGAVCVLHRVLLRVEIRFELVPRGSKHSAVRTPIRIEVHEGVVMSINHRLEVVVLELITGGAPVCIRLCLLLSLEFPVAEL
mmetsp:Transcript_36105/g.58273  ORF Transcript_36105/g.58273 Transcript_36105/m.58273 type:complete len:239 (+) Transcript_36105:391-1107(+)